MKLHELKIQRKFWIEIVNGYKTFEVRKDDRDYQEGDLINFNVIQEDGSIKKCSWDVYQIVYILRHDDFPEGVPEGYCILAIKELEEAK